MITGAEPRVRDRIWLEERDGRLIHVSIGSRTVAEILALAADPATWTYVGPQYRNATLLWEEAGTFAMVRQAVDARRPDGLPFMDGLAHELEYMLEYATKVRNAHLAGDFARAAHYAGRVAEHAWGVLNCCSPLRELPSEHELLADRLTLGAEAIPRYGELVETCRGLRPEPRTLDDLLTAALDLADGILAWLATLPADLLPEPVRQLLATDGPARYLAQLRVTAP